MLDKYLKSDHAEGNRHRTPHFPDLWELVDHKAWKADVEARQEEEAKVKEEEAAAAAKPKAAKAPKAKAKAASGPAERCGGTGYGALGSKAGVRAVGRGTVSGTGYGQWDGVRSSGPGYGGWAGVRPLGRGTATGPGYGHWAGVRGLATGP